jgi:hypothetical protein
MSEEKHNIRFDVKRGRKHQIRCEERKKTADSMSGEEENIRFDVRRGR